MSKDESLKNLSKYDQFVLKHVTPQNYAIGAAVALSVVAWYGCVYTLSRQLAMEQALKETLTALGEITFEIVEA